MLQSFTFGCGQGATKAMIHCITKGVLDKKYCCVVNSTTKDIPIDYQNRAIVISDDPDAGCGKVRGAAKQLMINYIKDNPNVIDSLITDEIDYVNIMATTEGASGSGASVILAQYIAQELNVPVIITLITGFEADMKGLQNTIDYFRDIEGNFVINTVSNKRFLEKSNNTFTAEKEANEAIANIFRIINMDNIENSDQNIDDTDHYKVITNPGMMFVNDVEFNKRLKNAGQFDQLVSDAIDYSHSLDFVPSATKIGIFLNISDDNLSIIDTTFTTIKKKLCASDCVPELFIHRQYNPSKTEFVRIIATGMNMPTQELEDMYTKFQNSKAASAKNDDFFDKLSNMDTSSIDDNNTKPSTSNKGGFFDRYEANTTTTNEEDIVLGRNRKRRMSTSSSPVTHNETQQPKQSKFSTSKNNPPQKPYSEDVIDKY